MEQRLLTPALAQQHGVNWDLTVSLKFLLVMVMMSLPAAPRPVFALPATPAALLSAATTAPTAPTMRSLRRKNKNARADMDNRNGTLLLDRRNRRPESTVEAIARDVTINHFQAQSGPVKMQRSSQLVQVDTWTKLIGPHMGARFPTMDNSHTRGFFEFPIAGPLVC